ncbi:MAG TPA: hypothetical protein P5567_14950 [Kiritimatiellia bacterium]|nr:hypothetical protein [Kiritimatiellia bacterium]HSA19353.1 hypothetical protein [Kiritimatiellia bacterium]
MSNKTLKVCFLAILAGLAAGRPARAAGDPAALRAELDSVRRELAELQSADPLAGAARWQQRDRAEYDVPEAAEFRAQVKAIEKGLVEKRAALRNRLTALFPEMRELTHARDAAYEQLAETNRVAALVDNEIRLAERADPPDAAQVERLRAERERLRADGESARQQAEEAQQKWLARQKELAAGDPECARLQAEIAELEPRFEQARQQLNETIDALPASREAEAARRAQVARVIELKQREQALSGQLSLLETQ